uniref:NADH-ubiquinone oxidoreductase chain 3 n=1 Tax=Caryophyllaeus sp. JB-2012 TaxID=1159340 RepID=H9YU29_9CEST|nr:NADH dehydrogenase subunit 3 [Caryophyllaeus sp. JB-2012]AFH27178.1 NADH dehydrogenase subunit 3 [Caryophyllaeus sp. JB-2012]AFH27179.1 NADH dehydrogenase subunit 3 [Caryophyllaeus sp. JB-2012]AFH27181.1 NADH dehydrogenase subunit 3 [Caryophyllaeus sp. JB-2012]
MVTLVGVLLVFMAIAVIILIGCSAFVSRYVCCNSSWASPYECGFIPSSISFDSFGFSYFSLLVFFVVFDLEISLLLNMPEQDIFGVCFLYYFLFILILAGGFFVEALLGYIRWGY